jgi:hypothetical protein
MKLNDAGIVIFISAVVLSIVAFELHRIKKEDVKLAPVAEAFEHCAEAEVDYLLHAPLGTTQHLIDAEDTLENPK